MGNLTIRNLNDAVIDRLKVQAKANERSLEGEVRHVLTREVAGYLGTAEFLARADSLAATTADTKQTDSTMLIREDRKPVRVTVDASVAVKWFLAEDHREEARHLLAPRIERYVPDLLPVECANVIWKKARRREIASATLFLDGITKLSEVVRIQPSETLL